MSQRIASGRPPLEVWGGIECTINRVGDRYFDQLEWSGHYDRLDDLDRIAELGIHALRVPILWERVAPEGVASADWTWTDAMLGRLRALGIRPIATLVHHGSGPRSTHLLDDGFAPGLAEFAGAVAARYPWIDLVTPVNEPLTTARFSALYGHWFPHARDAMACIRALLNELRASSLAMDAIRRINPAARLVQTEDVGKVHSTPRLRYQADFENERRWLSFDLLCGRVDRSHPLWGFLQWCGIEERELAPFMERPCPPDVFGINYYVTSERFLDDRLERYPVALYGGNGRDAYVDVEVARVADAELAGLGTILRESAARYDAPLAVTEVHLGGPRCEQLRWLAEAWRAALSVRADGITLRAFTPWALLGSFNWHRLVTVDDGHYEAGAFDVRDGTPWPTEIAHMIRCLATGVPFHHPALETPGWWRRPERVLFGPPPDRDNGAATETTDHALVTAAYVPVEALDGGHDFR